MHYVIGDIHGCYNELMKMIDIISPTQDDILIFVGDYIDRGVQNYEVLNWIMDNTYNCIFLRGNHEEEYINNINLMQGLDKKEGINTNIDSIEDTYLLYTSMFYYFKRTNPLYSLAFDSYRSIHDLIKDNHVTFRQLKQWATYFSSLPYCYQCYYNDKQYIVVHAGFTDNLSNISKKYSSINEFNLYAREDAYLLGGVPNSIIISGHTPTIDKDDFTYNQGRIFQFYNKDINCKFYDIDCGCFDKKDNEFAKLACIRIEDSQEYYI